MFSKFTDINNVKQKDASNRSHKQGIGADTSKPPCKKSKLLRRERKIEKLHKMGLKEDDTKPKPCVSKSIEEFVDNISDVSKLNLKVSLF